MTSRQWTGDNTCLMELSAAQHASTATTERVETALPAAGGAYAAQQKILTKPLDYSDFHLTVPDGRGLGISLDGPACSSSTATEPLTR